MKQNVKLPILNSSFSGSPVLIKPYIENEAQLEKVDLLLVDDRPENLLALEAALTSPEYNLIKTTSGDEALKYLMTNEPALILMDIQMPKMDGFEIASVIKGSERTREIPIIFITAIINDETHIHKGYDHGAVDYIQKPYDVYILKSKVAIFAELARKTRRLVQIEQQLRRSELQTREHQIAHLELKSMKRDQVNQKKFQNLVEGISHGIVWSASTESLLTTFVSPSAQRILGYSVENWLQESGFIINHTHLDDQDKVRHAFAKAQRERTEVSFEHRFVANGGDTIWLTTGLRVIEDDHGRPNEIRGLSIDVTKIKNAETALEKNKRRSDFLAEASLVLSESLESDTTLSKIGSLIVSKTDIDWYAIFMRNETGEVVMSSIEHHDPVKKSVAQKIFSTYEIDQNALIGVPRVIKTGTPELYSTVSEEILKNFGFNSRYRKILNSFGLRSIMITPLSVRGETFGAMVFSSAESGHIFDTADLAMAKDLSRRFSVAIDNAKLYKQTYAAVRARDEFLSIASHELKTPLTPLKIQTQALLHFLKNKTVSKIQPERLSKMLEVSDRQLTKLSKLIDDLLDISRINEGKLNLRGEDFDVVDLTTEVLERFKDQAANVGCGLSIQSEKSRVKVHWDRLRTEQIITNLLSNAIKYAPGKPIGVTIQEKAGRIQMSVKDQGIGIAKTDQDRIFKRFERAVAGDYVGGLGLGLYIVSQIVEAHGGYIHVQSEIKKGSSFVIDMPLKIT